MSSIHNLPEHTKRLLDHAAFVLSGVSAATVMSALNAAAVVLACIASLVSISWGICRWRDRIKYGPPNSD